MSKDIFKKIIGFLIFLFSIYLFLYFKYSNTSFILVYHQIENYRGGLKSLYVSPLAFEKQMRYLYSRGYTTITLTELKHRLENKLPLKKMFCITFDDGYKNLNHAYSILKKYNFKATVYLHIDAIQTGVYSYPKMPASLMISFEEMKKMLDVFEIGNHTLTHPDLTTLSEKEIIKELRESNKVLEKFFNLKPEHFCYPFGKVFKNHKSILSKEDFLTATTLETGLIEPANKKLDLLALPRIEWKELSSMSLKDFLKNLDFYIKIFLGI
ncbi:MAG: polysaccharide deacetylase family protein [Endomicrobiia bacterium]